MLPTSPTYHRPLAGRRRAQSAALAFAVVVLTLLGAAPAGAATLLISGTGDGHGVGMSQDGALGYASHGFTYAQILAHYYTGTTIGQAPAKSVVRVLEGSRVVRVPLERYVRGVVSAEMPSNWPAAALQAQAVASRTYALTSDAGGARFDVYSDTRSQMYLGKAAETASTNAAVAATAGQVVTYAGKPVPTYYFASSGGETESIQNSFLGSEPEPWLVAVPDQYEGNAAWKLALTFHAVGVKLRGLLKGNFRAIEVTRRGVSPRIVAAVIVGTGGRTPVTGPELAARFGLTSTWAYFSVRHGTKVTPEPDHSGTQTPPPAETPQPEATPPSTVGPGGGAPAPGSAATSAKAGGASAP